APPGSVDVCFASSLAGSSGSTIHIRRADGNAAGAGAGDGDATAAEGRSTRTGPAADAAAAIRRVVRIIRGIRGTRGTGSAGRQLDARGRTDPRMGGELLAELEAEPLVQAVGAAVVVGDGEAGRGQALLAERGERGGHQQLAQAAALRLRGHRDLADVAV